MIDLDDELAKEYLVECGAHTATIKAGLLALHDGRSEVDSQQVERILRAIRAIRGGGFFDLGVILNLAQQMEDVLELIHSRAMAPTVHRVLVLLHATGLLDELIKSPRLSNSADISAISADLSRLCIDHQIFGKRNRNSAMNSSEPATERGERRLLTMVVEDDSASRILLETFLARYGECHLAANGREAVAAFHSAIEANRRYDLICMDIMMPEMDGREALRQIRALEQALNLSSKPRTKIIMATAVNDAREVFRCYQESCDAFLLKPIDLGKLAAQMRSYQMIVDGTGGRNFVIANRAKIPWFSFAASKPRALIVRIRRN